MNSLRRVFFSYLLHLNLPYSKILKITDYMKKHYHIMVEKKRRVQNYCLN